MGRPACAVSEQRGSAARVVLAARYGHKQRQARRDDSEVSTVTTPPHNPELIGSALANTLVARADTPVQPLGDMLFQRLLRHRIIFLGQQVDDDLANRICAELILLAAEDDKRDINLYINSPGGSVYAGMAIYDVMQFVKNDVATYAMGMAASMGQFLLCAGARGKRYAMPHAAVLMHQPSGGIGGTATDIRIQAEQSLYIKRLMAERIALHTGKSVEQIEEDSDRDRWFTAEEARDYGIVDHVVTSATEVPSAGPGS
jgi:ATP-dependent Clp protease, protease subunit